MRLPAGVFLCDAKSDLIAPVDQVIQDEWDTCLKLQNMDTCEKSMGSCVYCKGMQNLPSLCAPQSQVDIMPKDVYKCNL